MNEEREDTELAELLKQLPAPPRLDESRRNAIFAALPQGRAPRKTSYSWSRFLRFAALLVLVGGVLWGLLFPAGDLTLKRSRKVSFPRTASMSIADENADFSYSEALDAVVDDPGAKQFDTLKSLEQSRLESDADGAADPFGSGLGIAAPAPAATPAPPATTAPAAPAAAAPEKPAEAERLFFGLSAQEKKKPAARRPQPDYSTFAQDAEALVVTPEVSEPPAPPQVENQPAPVAMHGIVNGWAGAVERKRRNVPQRQQVKSAEAVEFPREEARQEAEVFADAKFDDIGLKAVSAGESLARAEGAEMAEAVAGKDSADDWKQNVSALGAEVADAPADVSVATASAQPVLSSEGRAGVAQDAAEMKGDLAARGGGGIEPAGGLHYARSDSGRVAEKPVNAAMKVEDQLQPTSGGSTMAAQELAKAVDSDEDVYYTEGIVYIAKRKGSDESRDINGMLVDVIAAGEAASQMDSQNLDADISEKVEEEIASKSERRWEQPPKDKKALDDDVRIRLEKAKGYYSSDELSKCREETENILRDYPWHKDAVNMLRQVCIAENKYVDNERAISREHMMKDVSEAWSPRTYGRGEPVGGVIGEGSEVANVADAPGLKGNEKVEVERMINRMFNVLPATAQRFSATPQEHVQGEGEYTVDSEALKSFFGELGVQWPEGSRCWYLPLLGKLAVSNTPDSLDKLQSVLDKLHEEDATPEPPPADFGPFVLIPTAEHPLSTFGLDVDSAGYWRAVSLIDEGARPDAATIRQEEFINAFDYGDLAPAEATFRVYLEGAASPFRPGNHLLRVGVKGRRLGREEQRPLRLTILLDASGSMETPERMALARRAIQALLAKLSPGDTVTLLTCSDKTRRIFSRSGWGTDEAAREAETALGGIRCQGATNLEDGIVRAFESASADFAPDAENRVVILSDGIANLGSANAEEILAKVAANRDRGISCSVIGVGRSTYNDTLLEAMANRGNGQYRFLDSEASIHESFVEDLQNSFNTIAADVKIQVEWNAAAVKAYRSHGYDSRALKDEQFRDDSVDAGEVGSGQGVTVVYEMQLAEGLKPAATLGIVRIRYRRVDTGAVEEIEAPIAAEALQRDFARARPQFRLACAVAEFATALKHVPPAAQANALQPVAAEAVRVAVELDFYTPAKSFAETVKSLMEIGL